jgi:anaerobic selenocysteine-containing dehydrogenase
MGAGRGARDSSAEPVLHSGQGEHVASDARVVTGHCGICPSGCAVRITLQGNRISRVAPDTTNPHAMSCRRVGRAAEIVHSPDRLLFPLKRTGARGENRFARIGWEEALDTIAAGLHEIGSRYGPQAVCQYNGRGTFERSLWEMLSPAGVRESCAWSLLFPFGSPNTTGAGSNCYVSHAVLAPVTTFGVWWEDTFPDLEQARLIVVWGTNPANASPPEQMSRIDRAVHRGAKVVVIDHRRTETARRTGAEWLAIRPGTDGALALSMIHVLIREGLYDRVFAERWTAGFEELKEYAAGFPPEEAQAMTGIPADTIRRVARAIRGAGGASLLSYTGLEYTTSGVQNIRAVMTLWALSGNLDVPGGNLIKMPDTDFKVSSRRRIEPPSGVEPVGKSAYPLYHHYRKEAHAMELPRAILHDDPYPVRGMLVFGASIITGYPDPSLWRRSFSALDFLLVVDRFPTEDARYADIILPAATSFEEDSYLISGRHVRLRRKVIEPLGESRSDWDIVAAIAARLGYGHLFPRSAQEMLRWAFEGTEIDLDELARNPEGVQLPATPMRYRKWESGALRGDGKPGFETPSGKFEISSSVLKAHGYDPLPVYKPPREGPAATPELTREFPLIFNSGARNTAYFCSQHRNIAGLVKQRPNPLVWIHPHDALPRGIADGDPVDVVTRRGGVRFQAKVTRDIAPGAVEADANGGSPLGPSAWRECNVNELTDPENRDPLSGFPVYKALLCEVRKAGP